MSPSLLCGETEVQGRTKHHGNSIPWERRAQGETTQDTDNVLMLGRVKNGNVTPILLETLLKTNLCGKVNLTLRTVIKGAS